MEDLKDGGRAMWEVLISDVDFIGRYFVSILWVPRSLIIFVLDMIAFYLDI